MVLIIFVCDIQKQLQLTIKEILDYDIYLNKKRAIIEPIFELSGKFCYAQARFIMNGIPKLPSLACLEMSQRRIGLLLSHRAFL